MRTQPLFEVTAFDACDDPGCGCETCVTPWGTKIPTLVAGEPSEPQTRALLLPDALEFSVDRGPADAQSASYLGDGLALIAQIDQSLRRS